MLPTMFGFYGTGSKEWGLFKVYSPEKPFTMLCRTLAADQA